MGQITLIGCCSDENVPFIALSCTIHDFIHLVWFRLTFSTLPLPLFLWQPQGHVHFLISHIEPERDFLLSSHSYSVMFLNNEPSTTSESREHGTLTADAFSSACNRQPFVNPFLPVWVHVMLWAFAVIPIVWSCFGCVYIKSALKPAVSHSDTLFHPGSGCIIFFSPSLFPVCLSVVYQQNKTKIMPRNILTNKTNEWNCLLATLGHSNLLANI